MKIQQIKFYLRLFAFSCWFSAALIVAQPLSPPPPQAPAPLPATSGSFGQIIAGATAVQQSSANQGFLDFQVVETPQTGLGPLFNDSSCLACHGNPSAGGSSRRTVTRFGQMTATGFDPLVAQDGTLLHARAIAPSLLEKVPSNANVTSLRLTTPLYGAGLIEAIPDSVIVANAAKPKPPGIAGRVAWITDTATGQLRVGRFGWKNQHATLLAFSADALNNEIGVTNRLFPKAAAPDGNETLLAQFVSPSAPIEDQPSVITGLSEIDRLTNYMRYLAPPLPAPSSTASVVGRGVFNAIGCAACHTPTLTTGPNSITALANQAVNLYSDLLLHDMGTAADGIAQGVAGTSEMRTSPLWGIRVRQLFMHDGRATTLQQAILDHAGEGTSSTQAYTRLSATQQNQLLAFLSTL
jgi:CxxC motif-containing protein (DUF1111 family)